MVQPGAGSAAARRAGGACQCRRGGVVDPAGEAAVRFGDAADDPDTVRDLVDAAAGAARRSGCGAGPTLWGWALAVGVALSATIGQYFWVQAFKSGEMSAVAPFEYLRLPFAVFVGWLIWGEMPVIWTYVGAAIVIASALYIAQREAQLAQERRLRGAARYASRRSSLFLEQPRARLRAVVVGDVGLAGR